MVKKNARLTIFRTAMIGGGLAYDALVPVSSVENYIATRYTTVPY